MRMLLPCPAFAASYIFSCDITFLTTSLNRYFFAFSYQELLTLRSTGVVLRLYCPEFEAHHRVLVRHISPLNVFASGTRQTRCALRREIEMERSSQHSTEVQGKVITLRYVSYSSFSTQT